jgi:energy-converting hydrogenase Eha subunit H
MCQLQQFHLLVGTLVMGIVSPVLQEVCCQCAKQAGVFQPVQVRPK